MLFSAWQLWRYFSDGWHSRNRFDELTELIELPAEKSWTKYGALFKQNPDMVGWITIEGTAINYPVMQTPERAEFYLRRNFEKQYSVHGVPFAAESCSIKPQSDNITIHGHNMKDGTMFSALGKYRSRAFYEAHSLIHFDTRVGFGVYEIIAIFSVNPEHFQYAHSVDTADEAEFSEYINRCKALSFYDIEATAEYGDNLITLSTCEAAGTNSRLVIVARKT